MKNETELDLGIVGFMSDKYSNEMKYNMDNSIDYFLIRPYILDENVGKVTKKRIFRHIICLRDKKIK